MRNIKSKKALVTGAASGIGRAIALRLARAGTDLFLLDINEVALGKTVTEAKRHGVEVIGDKCDVTKREEIFASIARMLEAWGHLDILVNNVGVAYYGPTHQMSQQQWDWLMSINLHAPIEFTRQLLPVLLRREESHVLNVSSVCGLIGSRKLTAYNVSKFGLIGLSEALRSEYTRFGLGVTTLCPGFVSTQIYQSTATEAASLSAPIPPAWIRSTPERVAEKAIRAIRCNQRLALVSPLAYVLHYLKRFAPSLVDFITRVGRRRRIKSEPVIPSLSNQQEATTDPNDISNAA